MSVKRDGAAPRPDTRASGVKLPVSVLLITKNEKLGITRCIESVVDRVDEVVVIDSNSDDGTQELAEKAGARVIQFDWDRQYPKKKQWGLDNGQLRNDWVLLLDGDEYATPALLDEIAARAGREDGVIAYDVPLRFVFLGREMKHGYQVTKRIVFDRTRAGFPVLDDLGTPNPFEMELHVQPVLHDGSRPARFSSRLEHEDLEPIAHWFDRHNRYSDWEAHLKVKSATAERTRRGTIWNRVPFKSLVFFLYCFVLKRGFLDGRSGFEYALAQSFYYRQIGVKVRDPNRED